MNFQKKIIPDKEIVETELKTVQTKYRDDRIGDVYVYATDENFRIKGTTVGFQITYKDKIIRKHFSTIFNAVIFIQEIYKKNIYPIIEDEWNKIIKELNLEVYGGDDSKSNNVDYEANLTDIRNALTFNEGDKEELKEPDKKLSGLAKSLSEIESPSTIKGRSVQFKQFDLFDNEGNDEEM